MKVIDLLNKIANGEEVPNKIKWNDFIYEKSKYNATPMGYYHRINGGIKLWFLNEINDLNDEVEILEEPKGIPEKIKGISWYSCINDVTIKEKELAIEINKTQKLLNQVIDYLEYLESKGE